MSKPFMQSCRLTRLNVKAGSVPTPGEDMNMRIGFNVALGDNPDVPNGRTLDLTANIEPDTDVFYSIEANARALFVFEGDASSPEAEEYLQSIAPKEVMASLRTMLDSVTAMFPYGSISIPDIDVSNILFSS